MTGALLARKMAGGKKRVDHVAWQIEVTNNEEWEDLLKLQGLIVVDVYSEWCGPCQAMASHLKEIKLQLGDDLLHCALAKSDSINQLAKFRGRSEPTWLFMAGGEPVSIIRGANAPLIRKTLLTELDNEKQVLANSRQRAPLVWDKIEFPKSDLTEEEGAGEEKDSNSVPDNWTEVDAALELSGPNICSLLDAFLALLTSDWPILEVSSRTTLLQTKINEEEGVRDLVILWLNHHPAGGNIATDDQLDEKTVHRLNDWLDSTFKALLQPAVEPNNSKEENNQSEGLAEETNPTEASADGADVNPSGGSESGEANQPHPAEENRESGESPDPGSSSSVTSADNPPAPDLTVTKPSIHFRIYADAIEKEALVGRLRSAAAATAALASAEAAKENHPEAGSEQLANGIVKPPEEFCSPPATDEAPADQALPDK